MTKDEFRATVLRVWEIGHEADRGRIKPAVNFRDQLDLDSMDFLNIAIGLSQALGADIPESDSPKLATLEGCVEHLASIAAAPDKETAR
jgi:acyl carrier protein